MRFVILHKETGLVCGSTDGYISEGRARAALVRMIKSRGIKRSETIEKHCATCVILPL